MLYSTRLITHPLTHSLTHSLHVYFLIGHSTATTNALLLTQEAHAASSSSTSASSSPSQPPPPPSSPADTYTDFAQAKPSTASNSPASANTPPGGIYPPGTGDMPSLCASLAPPSLRMEWTDLKITNGVQELSVQWNVCTGHVNGFMDKTWLTCSNFLYHTRKPSQPPQPSPPPQPQSQPHSTSSTSGPSKSTPSPDSAASGIGQTKVTPDGRDDNGSTMNHYDVPQTVQCTTIRMDTIEVGLLVPIYLSLSSLRTYPYPSSLTNTTSLLHIPSSYSRTPRLFNIHPPPFSRTHCLSRPLPLWLW